MAAPARLNLRLLGELELARGGERLTLPASKKTRALLAYLVLAGKPQRRERLCELLWDVPDDPRGALRWSLSKLRPLVDEPGRPRILAERDSVGFDAEGADVDLLEARALLAGADRGTEALERAAALFRGDFLEGLELPNCPEFQAWRAAEREDVRSLRRRVLTALIERLAGSPGGALPYARELVGLDPYALSAHETLLKLLVAAGRSREAGEQFTISSRVLAEASGRSAHALGESWRTLSRAGDVSSGLEPRTEPDLSADQHRAAFKRSQAIRFCTASDGVRIAYSTVGYGPPLVKAANWLNHLEFDWESPVWRHWMRELSRDNTLVRYDERGNGLSDWSVPDISFEAFVHDLECVVDAAGLDRFTLLGISQGVPVSIAYAVRHPERLERLVLYGGYLRGWRRRSSPDEMERREAMSRLILPGWGQDNPAFRQIFTALFIPEGTPEQIQWFNELLRVSTSPANAKRLADVFSTIDVTALAHGVRVPTLVLHCRHDARIPYEESRSIASAIPGARFVLLEGRNHIILEHEPAWIRFVAELRAFIGSEAVQTMTTF